MILTDDAKITRTGHIAGETVAMTVDLANLSHIMRVLTDLYSDPALAVIREYSTNALDSHRMAGVTNPIEVTVPTTLKSVLEIKDFGLGMSRDDLTQVYGSYGTSTKRNTNDAAGCLGLGSKSALTYTNSFTVEGIKDGTKTVAIVTRNEAGAGEIKIVGTSQTDDPNGVTVKIPVTHINTMVTKITDFFAGWPGKDVTIHGLKHRNIYDDGIEVNDGCFILPHESRTYGTSYVVMGGVPYKIPFSTGYGVDVYYPVEMGSVEFVPSREALNRESDRTQRTLDSLKRFDSLVYVKEQIAQISDDAEAFETYIELTEKFGLNRLMIQRSPGVTFTQEYYHPDRYYNLDMGRYYKNHRINTRNAGVTAWLDKPADVKMDRHLVAKINKFTETDPVTYIIVGTRPDDPFLTNRVRQLDYAKINALNVPKPDPVPRVAKASGTAAKPKYDVFVDGRYGGIHYRELTPGKPLVYVKSRHNIGHDLRCSLQNDGIEVVIVPPQRQDKFLRMNPTAMTPDEYAKTVKLPKITKAEAHYLRNSHDIVRARALVKGGFTSDRRVRKIANLSTIDGLGVKLERYRTLGKDTGIGDFENYINDTYPMLNYVSEWDLRHDPEVTAHVVDYMRMVWKETHK